MPQIQFNFPSILFPPYVIIAFYAAAVVLVVFVLLLIARLMARRGSYLPVAFEMAVMLITLPKITGETESRENTSQKMQEKISMAETFLSSIGGLKAQRGFKAWFWGRSDHLSFEIVAHNKLISFYAAVPRYLERYVEQQIYAQYPEANIELVEDYNIFSPQGVIAGAYLKFKRSFIFPVKTYKKMDSDPLNGLTNGLSKLSETDGAAIQFVVRSAHPAWHSRGQKIASLMQQGKKYEQAAKELGQGLFSKFVGGVLETVWTKKKEEQISSKGEPYRLSPMEEEMVKGIEEKTSKAGLDVNIRIIVSSDNKSKAQLYLDNIVNAFAEYNIYEYGNAFERSSSGKINQFARDFIFRRFEEKKKVLLNTEETASVFHFPLPYTETQNIQWLLFKSAPAPANLPASGIILGINKYRGVESMVRLTDEDRRRHLYVIGQTGTGKSVTLTNLALQDIQNGKGVCVIDPHGSLVEDVAQRLPQERLEDVIYFDPSDLERPMGLNLLEYDNPDQKTFVINEMISIIGKLYNLEQTGGPIFEQYMKNAMELIMDDPSSGSTLMEISKVLADADFRAYKLSKCQTQVVKDFWEKEAQKAGGEASLANMVPYITSKLNPFITNNTMRPIIAQQKSAFNFRKAMDERKILLINLSKGKIGELNSSLLGLVIVGKLLMSALSRADIPESERHDFYLYIDEFQNYITESISIILSEARKYRLCLNIAHQFIGQLTKDNDTSVRDAVFGNVGSMVAFRVGAEDAEFLVKQFDPVFNEHDLMNVANLNGFAKILINGQVQPPFNIWQPFPSAGKKEIALAARALSRYKYGRDRREVEEEILGRSKIDNE